MKKLVFSPTPTLFAASVLTQALLFADLPRDKRAYIRGVDYNAGHSSIGQLVKLSDMGGFGQVVGRGHHPTLGKDYFTLRV